MQKAIHKAQKGTFHASAYYVYIYLMYNNTMYNCTCPVRVTGVLWYKSSPCDYCKPYTIMTSDITRTVTFTMPTLQRTNTEHLKQIFPEKELCGQSPNWHIHVSVSDLYIPTIHLPFLLQEILYVDRSWEYINRSQTHECGIGTEAVQFPGKEYIHKWDDMYKIL